MMSRGAVALTDAELLALLVESSDDSRDPLATAEKLLAAGGSLAGIARTDLGRLRMAEGLGLRRAERLILSAEFGRRVAASTEQDVECISTDADVVRLMRPIFDPMRHEECWVLYLTSSNRLLERRRVSQGGVQATVVDHRLIVKRALELLSTQIIMIHNHPSGAAEPSAADKTLTEKVRDAAALFDIRLLDHIIISREGEFSFRRMSLL
ncbi:DNA repair protein RadC [Alistipes sp. Z76]|nr:DNA repair protein RadC [Alistipes sp. Z76]NCE67266.1 DNA repair protein RadC [Muribaculaceae bacterium M3]